MPEQWSVVSSRAAVITDLGRHAIGNGVSTRGALDQLAARTANALVANPAHAPVIELTLFDLAARTSGPAVIALTGAEADLLVNGCPVPTHAVVAVPAGALVEVRRIRHGLRCYLAAHGSFAVERFLGSCAPDPVLGFGRDLDVGDTLFPASPCGVPVHPHFGLPLMCVGSDRTRFRRRRIIDVVDGPDVDEFEGSDVLYSEIYTVDPRSNDTGIRLTGTAPARSVCTEPRSSGVPVGAVEVTGSRQVIALHRGRGVTAGYAIPAVATLSGLDALAQVRPGDSVTFRRCDAADAVRRHREDVRKVDELRRRASTVLTAHGLARMTGPRR